MLELSVSKFPEGIDELPDDKSYHASSIFCLGVSIGDWFRETVAMPLESNLSHPNDVPFNLPHAFRSYIGDFEARGLKVWDIQNSNIATQYLKLISAQTGKYILLSGRADFVITRNDCTKEAFLFRAFCVIEVQSKRDLEQCENQLLAYLVLLMNTKGLPWLVGMLVYNDGQCRAFKATRNKDGIDGDGVYQMNDRFHVSYLPGILVNILAEMSVN